MSNGLLLKLVRIWWAGFKVLCRWLAFWIVLVLLSLPAMGLAALVGDYAGYLLGTVFFVLIVPIVFYLTSKYLLLLGDNDRDGRQREESPTNAGKHAPSPEAASCQAPSHATQEYE